MATQYASAACKLTIFSHLFARWRCCSCITISFVFIRQVAPVPACWQFNDISNKLTFDLLTLTAVSESCVTWATSVPILVFLNLSVLDLGPMYATDRRQTDVRQKHRLMPPPYGGGGIIIVVFLLRPPYDRDVSRRMVVARSNCSRKPSNRSRMVVVSAA